MKILGLERDETACNHYRIIQPLAKLKEQGLAEVCFLQESMIGNDAAAQRVLESDVIVVPRANSQEWFKFLQLCRRLGKIVVSDYDDDPFNTSPLNPYYRFCGVEEVKYVFPDGTSEMLWVDGMADSYGNKDFFNIERNIRNRDMFRLNFKKSDLVTCTTDILAESLKTINPNTIVLPNYIDIPLYPRCDFVKRGLRIGWQGGASHYEDLYIVHKAVEEICKKYPDVTFVFFGDYRFYGLLKGIPEKQLEFAPWVKHNAYPYRLATLNLDIGICPLVDNTFNRNKSAIKYFEYSAVGAATIASQIEPYSLVAEHEKDILFTTTDESGWFDSLERLIIDGELRRKLALNAYDNINENYNADKFAHKWLDAYEEAMKKEAVLA